MPATAPGPALSPSVADLSAALTTGATTPHQIADRLADDLDRRGDDGIWITPADRDQLRARADELTDDPAAAGLPLYGIPFAVKDSIDVAGMPTTLACPAYAYVPERTAPAIARLLAAGALLAGKTNLDQFATGLNGTRSPYGIPANVYGGGLAPGGSSSGSALAVASGLVPVAVATDTAGSGRVPAALNGILGFKPSRGLISTVGLVPACRSLDCLSLMAGTVADLRAVFDVIVAPDPDDPWSRPRQRRTLAAPRIGLPPLEQLEFLGDEPMRRAHEAARAALPEIGPVSTVPLDPFLQAGELLYSGPWVAERLLQFADILATDRDRIHPVVATIIESGANYSAVDTFRAQYRLQELKAEVARLWDTVDVVVVPTIPTTFTVEQVLADPIATNTALGTYTHCGNLLDLCAIAVPAGLTDDGRPCSLMVLGPAGADDVLLDVAARLTGEQPLPAGPAPAPARTTVAVVGNHLAGQPRNGELTDRGAVLVERTTTAPGSRLVRVGAPTPFPALLPPAVDDGPASGAAIEVEVWELPATELPGFLAVLPDGLALGRIRLADGRTVPGLVAAPGLLTGPDTADGPRLTDITDSGGWRAHLAVTGADADADDLLTPAP